MSPLIKLYLLHWYFRAFLSWLVKIPSDSEQQRARQISASQINRLEELWKNNVEADFQNMDKMEEEGKVEKTLLRYGDGYQYQVGLFY